MILGDQKGSALPVGILIVLLLIFGIVGVNYSRMKSSTQVQPSPEPFVSTSPSPGKDGTCMSNQDCSSGMVCEQICLQTYPVQCQSGRCVPAPASPAPNGSGFISPGYQPNCRPKPECVRNNICLIPEPQEGWCPE